MTDTINKIAKKLGARGGKKTLEKYGTEHFKKINKLSQKARRKNPNN